MGWAPGAKGECAGRRGIAFKKSWKDNALLVVFEADAWLRGAMFCVGKGWEGGLSSAPPWELALIWSPSLPGTGSGGKLSRDQ